MNAHISAVLSVYLFQKIHNKPFIIQFVFFMRIKHVGMCWYGKIITSGWYQ